MTTFQTQHIWKICHIWTQRLLHIFHILIMQHIDMNKICIRKSSAPFAIFPKPILFSYQEKSHFVFLCPYLAINRKDMWLRSCVPPQISPWAVANSMGQESQWIRGTIIRQGNYCSIFLFVHNMTTTLHNLSEGLRLEQLSGQSGLGVKALKNKKL